MHSAPVVPDQQVTDAPLVRIAISIMECGLPQRIENTLAFLDSEIGHIGIATLSQMQGFATCLRVRPQHWVFRAKCIAHVSDRLKSFPQFTRAVVARIVDRLEACNLFSQICRERAVSLIHVEKAGVAAFWQHLQSVE